MLVIKKLINL
ncbi:hypothetical protein FOXB_06584 [Fusarium oxysporum f. sp. conglutinans Fo5176]|uniref:Uncharacterized protein n=1 Tax=Fusarium oxysporum (strain Fo5176) TaxID=660025 RepID=F9FJK5_FUSOF|nr:hypothetical protein FOXB_06584 [Fusarium oxysporum f. sp. conglutinans Fo5176]